MSRVAVIGGGISGLATARFLLAADPGLDLTVLEARDTPGGNVRSDLVDGRVLDRAANGWLDSEPAMARLLALDGLDAELLPASDRAGARWIWADGALHPVPLSPPALLSSRLLSWPAKLRMLLEPLVGRGPSSTPDGEETVAAFVGRRLGRGVVDRMVGPMCAGIHAAGPEQLSLRAAFPRMAELERVHRSLFLAMLRLRRGGAPPGHLHTLRGGAGALTARLTDALGPRVRLGAAATALEERGGSWRIQLADGSLDADAVVLACPAPAQARLVGPVDGDAADALSAIPSSPVAVVITAAPLDAWERPPDGFGVLVAHRTPRSDLGVLGSLYTSSIFPDHAPEGEALLRTIIGGAVEPDAAGLEDDALLARARRATEAFLGPARIQPRLSRIYRHPEGIPRYAPGHTGRVARVRAAQDRHPGLWFVGNHLEGIGVKDCARAAEAAAAQVAAWLGTSSGLDA